MPQSIKGIAGTHLIGSNSREISSVDRLNTAWTADEGGTKLWEYLLDVSRKHLTSSHDKNNRLTLVVVSDGQDNRSSPAEMQKDDGVNVFLESHWSHDRARFIDDDDMIKVEITTFRLSPLVVLLSGGRICPTSVAGGRILKHGASGDLLGHSTARS